MDYSLTLLDWLEPVNVANWYGSGMPGDLLPLRQLVLPSQRVYQRTAELIAADITASGARRGDRLPAERALSERYDVSRVTLRAALTDLASRGLVAPSASRGWFVTTPNQESDSLGIQGFADLAAAKGLPASSQVIESGVRASSMQESERLQIAPGARLFTMTRLRYLDSQVVVLEHNRLPLSLCPRLADTDFARSSLFATLRENDPPQIPSVASYEVEARHATHEERVLLEITDTTPVLVADQLAFNQDGRPLEYTKAVYRADRYRFHGSISH